MKFLIIIILVTSCTLGKKNQKLNGHSELYSEPHKPKFQELEKDERRIVIASTNDIKGNYKSQSILIRDNHNKDKQEILIGGTSVISGYFQILRDTYKNVLLLDSGNLFSEAANIQEVKKFYHANNYDAVTLGTGDFNLNDPSDVSIYSQEFGNKSKVPLVLSNLYELKTARVVEWKGAKSHLIKNIDDVSIGIIGLIPDDITEESPVKNRIGLYVENMLQSTLRHARLLKSLGADIIVVLTHQSIDCSTWLANETGLPREKVNFDPHFQKACDLENKLGEYLRRLPPQLVDVVIGGRSGDKMANFVNGIIVLGGFPDGKAFNFAEVVINTKTHKLITSKTVVHQPIFFCHEFFNETNDCFPQDKSVNHKDRVKARFLGREIQAY